MHLEKQKLSRNSISNTKKVKQLHFEITVLEPKPLNTVFTCSCIRHQLSMQYNLFTHSNTSEVSVHYTIPRKYIVSRHIGYVVRHIDSRD